MRCKAVWTELFAPTCEEKPVSCLVFRGFAQGVVVMMTLEHLVFAVLSPELSTSMTLSLLMARLLAMPGDA